MSGSTARITLESLAFGGDAVGRLDDGRVVFVPLGVAGDRVLIRLVQIRRSFCRGELVEVLSGGPHRRAPPCPHFGRCGGCQWQQVSYAGQLEAKGEIVRHVLGSASDLLAAPQELGYRRRTRLHWQRGDRVIVGFMRRGSREIIDIDSCPLWVPALRVGVDACRAALGQATHKARGTLVLLEGRGERLHVSLKTSQAAEQTLGALEGSGAFVGGQVLMTGTASAPISFGEAALESEGPLWTSAAAFFQANARQDIVLRRQVRRLAGTPSRVLELFAGVGNLTREVAGLGAAVVAVEAAPAAAELLGANVVRWGGRAEQTNARAMGPVQAVEGRAEQQVSRLAGRGERFDLVLLDPPREGCGRELLVGIAGLTDGVLYVSCDPMTLARDLSLLATLGFVVRNAAFLDMMPQTHHVEGVVLLTR